MWVFGFAARGFEFDDDGDDECGGVNAEKKAARSESARRVVVLGCDSYGDAGEVDVDEGRIVTGEGRRSFEVSCRRIEKNVEVICSYHMVSEWTRGITQTRRETHRFESRPQVCDDSGKVR